MLNTPVKEVALETTTCATDNPASPETPVLPAFVSKFVPVMVIVGVDPLVPLSGLIDVIVGGGTGATGMVTVNGAAELFPPSVATFTSRGPAAAFAAITNVAVSDVLLVTSTLPIVTPVPPIVTVVPLFKHPPVANPDPASVAVTVAPCTPLDGVIDVNTGGSCCTFSGAFQMRFPISSAMYITSLAIAMLSGESNDDAVLEQPPAAPMTVVMMPVAALTLRIRLLPVSAIYKLPAESNATPCGLFN